MAQPQVNARADPIPLDLRTELLFRVDRPRRFSAFGILVLQPPQRRDFPDDADRERLERMQEQLFELLAVYETARSVGDFRGLLGRNLRDLDHALRRCAWLVPRIDRALARRATHPDDLRESTCPGCPWITGQFDDGPCRFPFCPLGRSMR